MKVALRRLQIAVRTSRGLNIDFAGLTGAHTPQAGFILLQDFLK